MGGSGRRITGGEQKRKTFVIDFVNKPEDIRAAFEPYFTNATLETETDPYIVFHLATKLAQAGIYTPEQVREVAGLWVARKGNSALSAAISPAKNDFARRYATAIEDDDRSPSTLSTCSARMSPPSSGFTTS
jgi:type I restriction enzyme R subunit